MLELEEPYRCLFRFFLTCPSAHLSTEHEQIAIPNAYDSRKHTSLR